MFARQAGGVEIGCDIRWRVPVQLFIFTAPLLDAAVIQGERLRRLAREQGPVERVVLEFRPGEERLILKLDTVTA